MTEKYAPGTVAKVMNAGREYLAFRTVWPSEEWMSATDGTLHAIESIRPLVVLDLNDGGDFWTDGYSTVRSLLRNLRNPGEHVRFTDLADAIEQQTRPPRPEEPTGLGAVVEDAEGRKWVRLPRDNHSGLNWNSDNGWLHAWRKIDAVRVLSEGVQS